MENENKNKYKEKEEIKEKTDRRTEEKKTVPGIFQKLKKTGLKIYWPAQLRDCEFCTVCTAPNRKCELCTARPVIIKRRTNVCGVFFLGYRVWCLIASLVQANHNITVSLFNFFVLIYIVFTNVLKTYIWYNYFLLYNS